MLVYDCEILKAVPGRGKDWQPAPGIDYCAGWHDHANMGISCICAYDTAEMRAYVFLKDNIEGFARLARSADVLVGFNNIGFDDKLLAANGIEMPSHEDVPRFDILAETWESLGMGREYIDKAHAGYGLDAMAKTNLGSCKTGHGAHAPALWQQGYHGAVIDYCLQDVALTTRLAVMIERYGMLKNPLPEPARLAAGQDMNIHYEYSPASMAWGLTMATYLSGPHTGSPRSTFAAFG